MDSDSWLLYIVLLLLIIGGGYFAATEIAFASSNKIRLKSMADSGDKRAKRVVYIQGRFDKALTTLLIGNNIMHICASTLATVLVTRTWGAWAATYSTIILTIVVFLFSEMLPKSYAKANAESFALAVSGSLYFLMKLLTPITFVFSTVSLMLSKLTTHKAGPTVTEDELYDIIDEIEEEGTMNEERSDLIRSALDFDDITVADILTSRVDLVALDVDSTPAEAVELIKDSRHSRIPVYEDNIDNIIGVLGIRKYLKAYITQKDSTDLRELMDPPCFVHKSVVIDELLKRMQTEKLHMAIVTDDYGGVMGIVTIEDILEELVGEIWDEDDEVEDPFKYLGDGVYESSGEMQVKDVLDAVGYEDYDRDEFGHKTMNAWALENFDYVPAKDSQFTYADMTVTVADIENMRINKLIIKRELTETDGQ